MFAIVSSILLSWFALLTPQTDITDCFPSTQAHQFVYDEARIFTPQQAELLQRQLSHFTQTTSNVLVVLTVRSLCGYDKARFATTFGEVSGAGRKDKDNGIVLLFKPKTQTERGAVFIAVGTGLQGAITDALSGRIVDYEMIPAFRQGNLYAGLQQGVNILTQVASGEISEADYMAESSESIAPFVIFMIIFILVFVLALKYQKKNDWEAYNRRGRRRRRQTPWIFTGGSGFGGNSGFGGGGFGGGGGGFGGFGGGGFSGGGAGGSW